MQQTSRPSRRALICGVALTSCITCGSAWAQDAPTTLEQLRRTIDRNPIPRALPTEEELRGVPIDPELRLLARQLGDPSWERREEAMQTLLARGADVGQLCAVLGEADLSSEQQYRLLLVMRQQLLTAPRGAVGIRVDQRWLRNDVIIIEELLADLPAAEVLQVGDRITHLQGAPLRNWAEFRRTVQFLAPGDWITMTVARRVGEKPSEEDPAVMVPVHDAVEVRLQLGSAEKLINPDTGLPQRNSEIENTRRTQADAAVRRYAPRPRPVEIDGEDDLGLVVDAPVTSVEVDDHPSIRALEQELRRIAMGQLELTIDRKLRWAQQLADMRRQTTNPALSPRERELLVRVSEQYERMMRTVR